MEKKLDKQVELIGDLILSLDREQLIGLLAEFMKDMAEKNKEIERMKEELGEYDSVISDLKMDISKRDKTILSQELKIQGMRKELANR